MNWTVKDRGYKAHVIDTGGERMRIEVLGADYLKTAHLIAAAPDLLDALTYLLEQTVGQDMAYHIDLTEGEIEASQQAYAAIAKARGE